jgi:hypothetical protein
MLLKRAKVEFRMAESTAARLVGSKTTALVGTRPISTPLLPRFTHESLVKHLGDLTVKPYYPVIVRALVELVIEETVEQESLPRHFDHEGTGRS